MVVFRHLSAYNSIVQSAFFLILLLLEGHLKQTQCLYHPIRAGLLPVSSFLLLSLPHHIINYSAMPPSPATPNCFLLLLCEWKEREEKGSQEEEEEEACKAAGDLAPGIRGLGLNSLKGKKEKRTNAIKPDTCCFFLLSFSPVLE